MNDPRLYAVREALAAYASDADDPVPDPTSSIEAAVAVVLRGQPDDLELLLIKRARSRRDPWSGHMALPGGRRDAADSSLIDTAVRETLEETGVRLSGPMKGPLGTLPLVAPQSARLPRIRISPFVFGVPAHTLAHVASPEVAEVHWTPLATLCDPAVSGVVDMDLPDGARSFPCLRVHGEIVWGLTYRILEDFFARVTARGSGWPGPSGSS